MWCPRKAADPGQFNSSQVSHFPLNQCKLFYLSIQQQAKGHWQKLATISRIFTSPKQKRLTWIISMLSNVFFKEEICSAQNLHSMHLWNLLHNLFFFSCTYIYADFTDLKSWHVVRKILLETLPMLMLTQFTQKWLQCLQAVRADSPFDIQPDNFLTLSQAGQESAVCLKVCIQNSLQKCGLWSECVIDLSYFIKMCQNVTTFAQNVFYMDSVSQLSYVLTGLNLKYRNLQLK